MNIKDCSVKNFDNPIEDNIDSNGNENENENERLVELVRAGDKDAYEIIVQKYRDIVFATVFSIVKNHHTAEDITQDTFFEGYLKINTLIDTRKIGVWLIKIAKNKCYNYINRSAVTQREVELDEFIPDTQYNAEFATPENSFMDKYDKYIIGRIIKNLPDTHRNTTVMFYFKKYSRKKIAEVLDIPEGTVKRRLHDSRSKLRKEFERMADGENYTPSADFEKNIIRSINNISMINIYQPSGKGKVKEVKFGDIDNFDMTRIEMTSPTDGEIKDIARVSGVDRSVLESMLYDEEIKNTDKDFRALQFVSDTAQDKLGVILKNSHKIVTMISLSQSENTSDSILMRGVRNIYNLIMVPGYMNADVADVWQVMDSGRYAHVDTFPVSPAFEKVLSKTKGIIVSVVVSQNTSTSLEQINSMMSEIAGMTKEADIIFGVAFDDTLDSEEIKVTIVATDTEEPVYKVL